MNEEQREIYHVIGSWAIACDDVANAIATEGLDPLLAIRLLRKAFRKNAGSFDPGHKFDDRLNRMAERSFGIDDNGDLLRLMLKKEAQESADFVFNLEESNAG